MDLPIKSSRERQPTSDSTFARTRDWTCSADRIGITLRWLATNISCLLIAATCALLGANGVNAQTSSVDLAGRWTSQRHGYVLDITRCGGDWCGVKLNTDQTCGPLAMRLTNGASATERQGLVGTLALEPAVSTYKVRAHPKPADAVRPTEIHLLGNPDELPQPITRLIQFSDTLARGPEPMCKAEGKLS